MNAATFAVPAGPRTNSESISKLICGEFWRANIVPSPGMSGEGTICELFLLLLEGGSDRFCRTPKLIRRVKSVGLIWDLFRCLYICGPLDAEKLNILFSNIKLSVFSSFRVRQI
jgi:hypothetical protein